MLDRSETLRILIEYAALKIVAFDVHSRTELNIRGRQLPWYVVSYMKEGSCRLRLDGQDYHAAPGDVVLIPPHTSHDHVKDTDENTVFMWWHFTYQLAGVMDVLRLFELPVCFSLPNAEKFEDSFSQYMKYASEPRSVADILMKEARALELMAIVLEAVIDRSESLLTVKPSGMFAQMLTDMLRHPERHYSLEDLRERYHMHPTYISNQFKRIFGLTPKQFQAKLRLEQAKKLLLADEKSITQIANALGYHDVDDFTRFFKKQEGLSPRAYKKAHPLLQ